MPLTLNKLSTAGGEISSDGSFTNPVVWEVSALSESQVLEIRLYLRMENPYGQYCTNGSLYAIDDSGIDESEWYSFAQDDEGRPGTFQTSIGFEIPLGSEMPVWVRLSVPDGVEAVPKTDLRIAADYIEHEA